MTLVVDASVVVAALTDKTYVGSWAEQMMGSEPLAAPEHMPAEAANVLRRATLAGDLSEDAATQAHVELLEFPVDLHPYRLVGERVWELRRNVTVYDAWYVALAEAIGARLATLDRRLAAAPGLRCSFALPPASQLPG